MKALFPTLIIGTTLLAGCVGQDDPYFNTHIVNESAVVGCKYVGHVTSTSKNYGLFTGTANDARTDLLKQEAYKLNATHLVVKPYVEKGNTTVSEGEAYICQP